jgi:hypothetical protein
LAIRKALGLRLGFGFTNILAISWSTAELTGLRDIYTKEIFDFLYQSTDLMLFTGISLIPFFTSRRFLNNLEERPLS